MREEVFDFLREYGFTKEEVYSFQDMNEKMFFTDLKEVNKNINFFTSKGLDKNEIMYLFRENPFAITVKDNRLEALDKIYNDLEFDLDSIKYLIKRNPTIYNASPIELDKIVSLLKENNYTISSVRDLLMKNANIIDMTLERFKEEVKY